MNSGSKGEEVKEVPHGINPVAMGDLSVNSSFQTDINTLVQLGERAKYHEAKRDELLKLQHALAEDQQRFRYRQEQQMHDHLAAVRESLREQMQRKLDQAIQALRAQKDSQRGSDTLTLEKERQRIAKRVEARLQQEAQQMDTLHSLELQRIKMENEGKLQIKKQRILLNQTSSLPS